MTDGREAGLWRTSAEVEGEGRQLALRSRRSALMRGPVAIVGASCRFPGADGLRAFWQLLVTGADAVGEVDSQRWATRFFYHPERSEPGKSYTWAAGLIDGVDRFEPAFFGISPREAMQMDPQQRLLLELAWHAFEDAGIPPSRMRGSDTGVFIGASATEYSDLSLGDPSAADSYFMTGNALSILANRISYVFDLRGPSLTIDTACSSSLVALHHACAAIDSGQVSNAIVGGVNLLLTPYPFLGFCRASMLSRYGRCFSFDERADGYVRGEGAGVVILKSLAQALADGDPIRAVILATGCNSDGRTIGLSLPSEPAQAALLASVYSDAGIAVDDLAFFEMHGTGTPVGDPVEAAAVGRTIAAARREPLPIGSVKTNIGHLEPASGIAGLLKAMLALDEGIVPATLHCERPNSKIDFSALNLRLAQASEPIAIDRQRRLAGVNSFGFGGTNAHAVLAAPPQLAQAAAPPAAPLRPPALVISAATRSSLRELAGSWRALLAETPGEKLPLMLRAAARGRDHHRYRLVALGADPVHAVSSLDQFLAEKTTAEWVSGVSVDGARLAFVFSGNGAQYPRMGRAALRSNAAFRAAVEEVDRILQPDLGWSIVERIENGIEGSEVARADIAQPVLFAIQVGIVAALRAIGIVAAGHLGHSVGDIAAAWAAGALTLGDAARVVVARSHCQQRTIGTGRMAALALGSEAAQALLAEIGSDAEIAALNTVRSVTVSGTGDEIARLVAVARDRGLGCRLLDLDFAFHSRAMEPIREELSASLAGLSSQPPSVVLASSVTGAVVKTEVLDAEHWWANIRNPVRFEEATAALIAEGFRVFVEIGPSPILNSYLTEALRAADADGRVLASLTRTDREMDPFPGIAAKCCVAGHDWMAASLFDGDRDTRGLPLYPWERERFWLDKTVEDAKFLDPPFDHPLLGFRQHGHAPCWLNHLDAQLLPWIAEHAIEGIAVFPAAAVIETALAAARWRWPEAPVLELADVEIRRPLVFETGRTRELRTALTSDDGDWELVSRARLSSEPMNLHAVGRIAAADRVSDHMHRTAAAANGVIDGASLYQFARQIGLEYAGSFRTVDRIEVFGPDRALVHLDAAPIEEPLTPYLLHPALLDGALQGLLALLSLGGGEAANECFLPWRFGRVRVAAPFGRKCRRAELSLTRLGVRSASADLSLYDDFGNLVAELTGCGFRRVEFGRRSAAEERLFRVDLIPAPLTDDEAPAELARAGTVLAQLAASRMPDPKRREDRPLLDAAIGTAAFGLWAKLVDPDRPFTLGELAEQGRISSAATGLAASLLQAAQSLGGAAQEDGEWRITADADLPEAAEIWRLLLADAPDLVAELALAGAAIDDLPDTLTRGPAPAHSPPAAMVEHLLQASPVSAAGIDLLSRALGAIAARWPSDRPLRIIEIGAEGSATRSFLHSLAKSGATIAYLATSPDPEQTERLAAITRPFAGAAACYWSPGDGTGAVDAIGDARFDIAVAVNSCARLHFDATLLARLREIISPGGWFVAAEPEPNVLWDAIFGQDPEWWLKHRSGDPISPLRSSEEWQAELTASGFENTDGALLADGAWPLALFWGRAGRSAAPDEIMPAEPRSLMVIAEQSSLCCALIDRLGASGHRVSTARPGDLAAPATAMIDADGALDTIIFIAGEVETDGAAARQIATLARIAHEAAGRGVKLWIVTRDAHRALTGTLRTALAGAGLRGFARVLANELPRLSLRLIDLAGAASVDAQADQIADEIAAASPDTEIVWTAHGRHVTRLRPGLPPRMASRATALTLVAGKAGGLQSLGWTASAIHPPGPGEVEIEVRAAGLNFRDVMWAMGLLPEEALVDGFAGPDFGLECAGIICAIGAEVAGLTIGAKVMAFAPAALGSRVVTAAEAVVPIPDELGFTAAATLPVAFVTAIYALGHLAGLEPGEHVLVHAASGGVGLAAIQYAKHRGAVVIATAGSPIKRKFLRLAGADHVLDSRDLGFADAVGAITGGAGVDVVLNSLSGEAMERSLEVLKPFGRFLELGKRDFYLNRRLHLRPFRQNVSYFAIDVDQLPRHRPALARSLLMEVAGLVEDGAIRPLAHRVFRYSEVEDAFRLMQASGHIGKLVLVPDAAGELPIRQTNGFAARDDGTYLVTGGLDGFGFAAARWLAEHGAGALALLGRRGLETPGCEARIAELIAAGIEVRVYRADVADRTALAAVLSEIRSTQPPLRGVVHAASAIADRLTADISAAGIDAVLRPKLDGAVALDELTRNDPIEMFLLFSSATTLLGAPGQGAYVAANSALEALARRRHAEGRPALAVAWGPIEDAGYLAQRSEMREALARRLGAIPLPAGQALAALPAMLASGLPVVAFAAANWGVAQRFLPMLATPLFSEVRPKGESSESDEALADRLRQLDPDAVQALLESVVSEEAGRILHLPAGGVDPARPLYRMGMDSLMAVELRLALENRLRIDLPLVSLAEGTSVASIAARLANALAPGTPHAEVAALAARYESFDAAGEATVADSAISRTAAE